VAETFNAADVILSQATRLKGKIALICSDRNINYGELLELTERAAGAFLALGIRRADRVGLMMMDSPLYCAAFLGAVKVGAVAIPMNPRLPAGDYGFILAGAGMKLVVADSEHVAMLSNAKGATATRILQTRGGSEAFEHALRLSPRHNASAATQRDEPAFWLFSSGTTGRPKAIIHSHESCAQGGKLLREVIGADESTVVLGTSKLFFTYSLDNAFLGPLQSGATTIIIESWPEPEQVVEQIARHRPNIVFSVPTFYRRLLNLGAEQLAPLKNVRYFYSAGERLPDAIALGWRKSVGVDIHSCYGMSESFTNTLSCFPGEQPLGATGKLLAGVQARLLDATGREAGTAEPGVMWIKHPSLALGYLDADATAKSFRDGWFCTGDLFVRQPDGFYYHQGRGDELLRIAGQWV
jgi:acyl-coenzyme A synthetase/AMP-(fatty) acid ligase